MARPEKAARAPTGLAETIETAANLRDNTAAERDDRADQRDDASRARDRRADLRDEKAAQRDSAAHPLTRRLTGLLLQARQELRRLPPGDRRSTIEDILGEALDALHSPRTDLAADRIAAAGDRTAAAGDRAAAAHDRAHSAADRDQAAVERQQTQLPDIDQSAAHTTPPTHDHGTTPS